MLFFTFDRFKKMQSEAKKYVCSVGGEKAIFKHAN